MQPILKVANLGKTAALFVPVKLGNFAHRKSMVYVANQDAEFNARIAEHKANGTDMASESVNNFIWDQYRMVAYRIVKCREEWDYFKTESYKTYFNPGKWDIKSVIVEFKFFVHMLAVYLFAVMLGRNSMFPLLEPGSPFAEGLKYVNPNTNR